MFSKLQAHKPGCESPITAHLYTGLSYCCITRSNTPLAVMYSVGQNVTFSSTLPSPIILCVFRHRVSLQGG